MTARRAVLGILMATSSSLALTAHAQEAGPRSAPAATEDVVVITAAGYEQKIEQAPASISVLTRAEIEENRATSLTDILGTLEGVDVGDSVGKTGGQTINIRGMGADYTLVLIDGRRQNTAGGVTPNGFGETSTSFMPPVSAIERIEVVRGPMSTLYGSDAMGGVVNIITRKVGDVWGGSFGADVTLQGDDEFGTIFGSNIYANGPIVTDLLGLAVRGSYSTRDPSELTYEAAGGVEAPVTGFGRSSTGNEIWSLGGRLNFTPHADHDLWLDLDTSSQWYDNSTGQMGTNTTAGGYGDALEFKRHQAALAHNWRLGFGSLESNLSFNQTETVGRIIPNGVAGAGGPRKLESENTVFDTKFNSQWENHTFTVGGQYWDAEMVDGVAPVAFEHQQWALFAEDEWRFTETFAVTLGARYDDHSAFGEHLSPRAYAVWNLTDNWTLKGGVSQGFKTPRLEQLAAGINGFGNQGRTPLLGTPSLTPETSTSAEIAVFYDNRSNFRADFTVFNNTFEDKIATGEPVANCSFGVSQANYTAGNYVTTGCVDVGFWPTFATFGQSVNIDEAETRGFEASMNWRFADNFTLTGNYTYTDSEQKSGASIGLPLTNTPEHMLNAALRWQVNEPLNVWLRGEYRSERFRGVGAARTALGDFEAYSLFHLGGSYKLSENLTLGATIYNLLDTDFVSLLPYGTPVQYAPEYTNNQEPRRLWVSLNATF